MAQNIYDRPDFFEAYSQLGRSIHGLEGAPEWPNLQAMLPDMRGLRVVDLGCGFGWFCRWARKAGASSVLGIDLSEKMLARARTDTADLAVKYEISDLEDLSLSEASFDIAYSSLALHYVEDVGRLYKTIHRALVDGGRLVFSTEHPIVMAPTKPGWLIAQDGRKTWPVDQYFVEGPRTTDWLSKGVVKYHRTIGTTLNLLNDAGFRITRLVEFCPNPAQIAAAPALAEEVERPMFLLVAAQHE